MGFYDASIAKSLASISESIEISAEAFRDLSMQFSRATGTSCLVDDCFSDTDKTVGDKIRSARKSSGHTQEELSRKVGISRSTLAKYELGSISITVQMLYKISDALGTPVFDLLPESTDKEDK